MNTWKRLKRVTVGLVTATLMITMASCGTNNGGNDNNGGTGGDVTLQYWLWDDAQLPGYQKCADDFTAANPSIKVEITQTGWSQYWTNLATQVAAGSAPDVWTDQVSYYPKFVQDKQIVDLQPYIDKDPSAVDFSIYVDGLAELWTDGAARYGLPKDWDTIGLIINKKYAEEAGLSAADFQDMTWNPADGGTFEKMMARLTVDKNGVRGDEAGFDKNNVKVHGFLAEWSDGSQGQNLWGNLAVMNGFTYADKNPFGTQFNYNSPKLVETIDWMAGLSNKGYVPQFDAQSSLDRREVLLAGNAGMTTLGSFNQMLYKDDPTNWIFAPLPAGPQGRMSAINGLSDAMYAGGKHKDQAWEWIKYLASPACQNAVGDTGVIFPASKEASQRSVDARAKINLDAEVFLSYTKTTNGTFLLPISLHGTEIAQTVQDAIQSVALHSNDAQTALTQANDKVNSMFK